MRLKPRRRLVVPAKPPEASPAAAPTQDLEAAWAEAVALFSNRKGMRVGRHWSFGVSERLFPDRFARLTGKPSAKRATHLLSLLSDQDLRVFHTRAAIGHEQSVAGARLTLILNVSAPVGFLVLLNGLLPGAFENLLSGDPVTAAGFLLGAAAAVCILLYLAWYAFAGVQQARDLYHLATLEMARRGLAATLSGGDQNPMEGRL